MDKIVLKSPAKLNLFLKVIGKRPDGYHRIQTLFERIDLCDRIVLRKKKSGGVSLVSDRPDLPDDERNLAYKAALLLFEKARLLEEVSSSAGVAIQIKKRIPIGAGLGGGSSNAAAVLLGLNRLYNQRLSREALLGLARKLGADVAFFLHEYSFAIGESRGDIITPVKTALVLWHVLVVPPFGLSTKDVYESLDFYEKQRAPDAEAVIEAVKEKDQLRLNELLYNDLEKVALARHTELDRLKDAFFNLGLKGTLVSGSGPAMFGLSRTRKEAKVLARSLKKKILAGRKDWLVFVVRTT